MGMSPLLRMQGKAFLILLSLGIASSTYSSGGTGPKGIKCTLAQVKDEQRTGLVAFTYFVPDGWEGKNSLVWNGNTYVADLIASTPDKLYTVDQLEPISMNYSASSGTQAKGIRMTHATDFLHALVNRMQQQGGAKNVRVLEDVNQELPLADWQKLLQQNRMIGGMSQATFRESGFMKFTFDRNGVVETATVGTTVAGNLLSNNMALGFGPTQRQFSSETGSYVVGPTMLVVVPSQASAQKVKETQIVASSARITPKFLDYCANLALQMARASEKMTEERGRQLREDMEKQTTRLMSDFKARMAARDANVHDFCNYLLDQQDYHAPDGNIVTLPNNYNHAWANNQGVYILTDDHTFDPRGTDGTTWQEMPKAEHGH
jgi:hypothetical protein